MLSKVTSKKHGWHFTNRYANCTKMKKIIGAVINTETNVAKSGRWPGIERNSERTVGSEVCVDDGASIVWST